MFYPRARYRPTLTRHGHIRPRISRRSIDRPIRRRVRRNRSCDRRDWPQVAVLGFGRDRAFGPRNRDIGRGCDSTGIGHRSYRLRRQGRIMNGRPSVKENADYRHGKHDSPSDDTRFTIGGIRFESGDLRLEIAAEPFDRTVNFGRFVSMSSPVPRPSAPLPGIPPCIPRCQSDRPYGRHSDRSGADRHPFASDHPPSENQRHGEPVRVHDRPRDQ